MNKKRGFTKIFYGWWIVLTSGILSLFGAGYIFYGVSALFKPIASELGFSRAVASVAPSISSLTQGIEAPFTGWLTDRFGPRRVILLGALLSAWVSY